MLSALCSLHPFYINGERIWDFGEIRWFVACSLIGNGIIEVEGHRRCRDILLPKVFSHSQTRVPRATSLLWVMSWTWSHIRDDINCNFPFEIIYHGRTRDHLFSLNFCSVPWFKTNKLNLMYIYSIFDNMQIAICQRKRWEFYRQFAHQSKEAFGRRQKKNEEMCKQDLVWWRGARMDCHRINSSCSVWLSLTLSFFNFHSVWAWKRRRCECTLSHWLVGAMYECECVRQWFFFAAQIYDLPVLNESDLNFVLDVDCNLNGFQCIRCEFIAVDVKLDRIEWNWIECTMSK